MRNALAIAAAAVIGFLSAFVPHVTGVSAAWSAFIGAVITILVTGAMRRASIVRKFPMACLFVYLGVGVLSNYALTH
ncbi:MAG TPA: hypothetical protein VJ843_05550 [Candidatus Saccharimonadales bacterium]|nr:hypothetical protein [Candidatus Saccharimonadales bacterium]